MMNWLYYGMFERTVSSIRRKFAQWVLIASVSAAVMVLAPGEADAVPSFARQTGLPCSECHTVFPELTAFGRTFKMHGYTDQGMKELEEPKSDKAPGLDINRAFPLSVMLQTSLTRTDKRQPGTQNNNAEFPQQLSLFLAGEMTPHIGTFVQATYNGHDNHFTLDNTDIRYSRKTTVGGDELLYGLTLNNNPTVEDIWHTAPAWSFPFASADSAPTPAAAALVEGGLAQQAAGVGAYSLWAKHLYVDATLYRSAHIGGAQPPDKTSTNTIRDVAPYWRLAWQQNFGENYLEVGTFGLFAQLFPSGISGSTDKFTDAAFDTQYERLFGTDSLSTHLTYIYEKQRLNATHGAGNSANASDNLHTLRLDGIYHFHRQLALALGGFLTKGTTDAGLFAPAAITGSASGSPDSSGVRTEVDYYPWQNVRLSAQYTAYTEFNGRAHNYDGSGRDAADNNTLYLLAWLMY